MTRRRRAAWVAGAAALAAPLLALTAASAPGGPAPRADEAPASRATALDAAAGWRDTLSAYRGPQAYLPDGDRIVVLMLDGPAAAAAPPAERAAAAAEIDERQDALAASLASIGAEPVARYRMLLNGMAVRVPAGRLGAVAALADVRALVPVSLLAPARLATTARLRLARPPPWRGRRAAPPTSRSSTGRWTSVTRRSAGGSGRRSP